ncbi:MAG: YegS/Rv2252/BmrU family lipid kinase [Candidatus Sericytochromatia bacterium]|nr:YegS/Rv2252/BmrU family lipid kinase [Candidatus Sericytochromatia bacterium]
MLRYRILVNPTARNGADARWVGGVRAAFARTDHEIVIPGSFEAMCRAARDAREDGVDVVVVVGGDGTVNAVANQLVGGPVALAVVPAGTANDLARQLGMPLTPLAACQAILRGERRAMDVGVVNGQCFLTGGGTGIVSDVAVGIHALKSGKGLAAWFTRALGSLAYTLYSAWLIISAPRVAHVLTLRLEGQPPVTGLLLAMFVNNQPAIGRTVCACPGTQPDDGSLGWCKLVWTSRLRGLWLAAAMNRGGAHAELAGVNAGEARELELTADEPLEFMADGELLAQASVLRISVLPASLWVLAPPQRVGGGWLMEATSKCA